ncbi:MAG: PAS domain S-box protein [candidate division Zixibacteria bacterium]|nr:PAS domain S-box protein [candidate division Zixibacteria bacterium]MDH3936575.1 PAS domain S-box protein [candidate division Zixibacteria bacterium]MDH4034124.1 PAS domain S-box protein [candidate division Zixibacteria bacterium]
MRLLLLAAIMTVAAFVVVGTTMYVLYQTAFEQQRERLVETVQCQARLMEAIARYDLKDHQTHHRLDPASQHIPAEAELADSALEATLSQLEDAHGRFRGIGETGELMLARLQGDQIVFLLRHRHDDLEEPRLPVPFSSPNAEPMRRAVSGNSGIVVGLDHRGEQVLAAYEPVAVYNLGVVAQIDLAEIRDPFIRTGGLAMALAVALICLGSLIFFRIGNPMVKKAVESEEKLRSVLASSPDAITVCDLNGMILDCNVQTAIIHGYSSRAEMLGVKARNLFHSDAIDTAKRSLKQVLEHGPVRDVEFRMLRKDGSSFPGEMSLSAILDTSGNPISVVGITKDISRRKELEAKSEDRREQLDSLLANVDAIILEGDPFDIYYVGGRVQELLGYPVEDWFNHPEGPVGFWSGLLHPDDMDKIQICAEAISRGENHSLEYRMTAADGKTVWFFDSVTVQTENGVPIKALSVMTDITQRKQGESDLIESERRLMSHLQNTPVAAIEWNLDFEVTEWNHAAEQVFGYTKCEAMGRHAAGLIVPESARDHVNTVWTNLLQNKGGYHSENENSTKNGRIIVCDWNNTPLLDRDGKVCGVASLVLDITQRVRAEEALRKSEERFSDIANSMPGAVYQFMMDKEGQFSFPFMSDVLESMAGVPARLLMDDANRMFDLIHPDDHQALLESIAESARTMTTWEFEFRVVRPDKRIAWLKGSSNPSSLGEQGILWNGVLADITERRRAEEEFQRITNQLQLSVSQMPIAYILWDYDKKVIEWNRAAEQIFGYSSDEAMGKPFFDLVVPDAARPLVDGVAQELIAGKPSSYSTKDNNVRKGGELISCLWHNTPVRDADGRVTAVLSMAQDVTDRMAAEEALRESEEKFRRITERLFDVVITAELDSTIKYVSPSIQRVFGYSPDQVIDKPISDFIPESGLVSLRETFRMTAAGEMVEGTQCPFIRQDGTMAYVEVNAVPIRKDGQIIGAQAVIRDVTDRKRMEAELANNEKLDSIGVLAGGIAHDFNNVLTGVAGNLQLALSDVDPDSETGLCLSDADQAVARATDLTHQLLTFAKGGAPVKRTASIKEVIEQSSRFALHGSNVRCELSMQDDLLNAEVDIGQVNQVINNLIINADQAMPTGGTIFLNASNHSVDADSSLPLSPCEYICISVRDQGVGIEEAVQRRIFDPFFTTKPRGSGLGLATTYSIVRNHGGHIEVQSSPGCGAEFLVYLPATSAMAEKEPKDPPPARNAGGRILVMDDEACVREVALRSLQRKGFEVDTAVDGEQAIDLFVNARAEGRPFTIVILDLTVPGGLGGIETVDRLRRIDPNIPAIVCSGYSNDPILASYRDYGFQAIIGKPFRPRDLIHTVNRLRPGTKTTSTDPLNI